MPSAFGARVTAVLLGMLFMASGCLKTIKISTVLHREMLKVFKNLTDVCPFKLVGFHPSPVVYMQVVGVVELISGTALAFGTLASQKVSCVGLMSMMVFTSYSQLVLRDFGSIVMPLGYFLLLLWLYASLVRSTDQLKPKVS